MFKTITGLVSAVAILVQMLKYTPAHLKFFAETTIGILVFLLVVCFLLILAEVYSSMFSFEDAYGENTQLWWKIRSRCANLNDLRSVKEHTVQILNIEVRRN